MRSIVVLVTLILTSTPAVAEPKATILGDMVLTPGHGQPPPDDIAMRAPPSRPEYAGMAFFVPKSDVALAELEGWRVMTDEEIEAWLQKKFDDAAALAAAAEVERSVAGRWHIATILLGAVAVVTTALAAWLIARRRAAG